MSARITSLLAQTLRTARPEERLDVIVAFSPARSNWFATMERTAAIAKSRQEFAERIAPLREVVESRGGRLGDGVWLNQTLRVELPVRAVHDLVDLDGVELLDVPRRLQPDTRVRSAHKDGSDPLVGGA